MDVPLRCLSALIAGCLATGPAPAETKLIVAADTPSVEVSPRRAGRNSLQLPTIEYQFNVKVQCDDSWAAESVSVSVADTHRALGADQIGEDSLGNIRLRIPAEQIAPLVLENFCVAADQVREDPGVRTTPRDRRRIPGALSAHASLLCSRETERKVAYATQPLDIDLVCAPAESPDNSE